MLINHQQHMNNIFNEIPEGKKIFFASDFHSRHSVHCRKDWQSRVYPHMYRVYPFPFCEKNDWLFGEAQDGPVVFPVDVRQALNRYRILAPFDLPLFRLWKVL